MTWRESIKKEMASHGDSFDLLESSTLTDNELDETFDSDFGATYGRPFTLWTKTRVYFPVQYDGAEWAASVSRDPDNKPTNHLGA